LFSGSTVDVKGRKRKPNHTADVADASTLDDDVPKRDRLAVYARKQEQSVNMTPIHFFDFNRSKFRI